jgi:hypothetical protein
MTEMPKLHPGLRPKLPRPAHGVVSFQVHINADLHFQRPQAVLAAQDSVRDMVDDGVLLLPDSYDPAGRPLRLVINCHGAGTTITPSTTSLTNPVSYLVNGLGLAVMDMNGVPKELSGGTGLHFGSPLALQSYIKGYRYVLNNYNLDPTGCFVVGSSMGGLTSFMLAQSGVFPVLAQGGFCPVVDHFKQAWCNPWTRGQRLQIAKLFGFEGWHRFPGFTPSGYPSQVEIDYYLDNLANVVGCNPIMKYTVNWSEASPYSFTIANASEIALERPAYERLIQLHSVPLRIWHNDDDLSVAPRYSEYIVGAIRRSGGLAYLRRFASGGHNAWDNGELITTRDYRGQPCTVRASGYELGLWFQRFC